MNDVLILATIFLGMSSLVAVPLGVLLGLPLTAWLGRAWIRLKERELELRRLEVAARIRESRLLPAWVDENDPEALLAWMRTDRELQQLR